MVDTNFVDIAAEDIAVVEIVLVDIEQAGIELALVHIAYARHSSSTRYPLSSLAAAGMLCNLSHHVLQIYKIYNTD